MKKVTLAIFALATAVAISPVALVGQSTNFTIDINDNGLVLTGNGTISTTNSYSPSGTTGVGYLITSFNGTITGSAPVNGTGTATLLSTNPAPTPGSSFLSPD